MGRGSGTGPGGLAGRLPAQALLRKERSREGSRGDRRGRGASGGEARALSALRGDCPGVVPVAPSRSPGRLVRH